MNKTLTVIFSTTLFIMALSVQAVTLRIEPASQQVTVGGSLQATLAIEGLITGATPSLSVFDLDIDFNPTVLAFRNFSFGDSVLGDQLDFAGAGSQPVGKCRLGQSESV